MREEIKSGFKTYDELTGGFRKGDCHIISGMIGDGGTSLALTMANYIISKHSVMLLSTLYDYNYIEKKQNNFFGDETYNLPEMLPKYQPKEKERLNSASEISPLSLTSVSRETDLLNCPLTWAELQSSEVETSCGCNFKERFELPKIESEKDFLDIFKTFTVEKKKSPEIIFYVCRSFFNQNSEETEDKEKIPLSTRFFIDFAEEHNIAVVIITEINNIEIRKKNIKSFLRKQQISNLLNLIRNEMLRKAVLIF